MYIYVGEYTGMGIGHKIQRYDGKDLLKVIMLCSKFMASFTYRGNPMVPMC